MPGLVRGGNSIDQLQQRHSRTLRSCPLSFKCDGERITQGFPGLGRLTVSWQAAGPGELMVEFQAKGQQA